jgi:hypothetical protein
MNKVCNQCESEYQRIATHWNQSSSCSHKEFTDHQHEVITGILMGDGTIDTANKNPRLRVDMISPNYLQYVNDKFGILGNEVKMRMTAAESAKNTRKNGYNPNSKEKNYSDLYRWSSISHPDLQEFLDWYSSGDKVWPENIELTPTVLKHWYCGDGCWENSGTSNCINIGVSNEISATDKVSRMFENMGLPAPSNYNISERRNGTKNCQAQFTVNQSKELWEYMGEPLPDFEYKWPEEYHKT